MNIEILHTDEKIPDIPQTLMKEALEKKPVPVVNSKGEVVGTITEPIMHEDGSITGTLRVQDEEVKDLIKRMRNHQLEPVMGLSYTVRAQQETNEVLSMKVNSASIVDYRDNVLLGGESSPQVAIK